MSYGLVMDYLKAIEVIGAHEQLEAIQAGAYSNYAKKDQTKIIKSINKVINSNLKKDPSGTITTDSFADILSGGVRG